MEKSWYLSKTIWAGIIIFAVGVLKSFGIDVPTEIVIPIASGLGIVGIRSAIEQKK